MNQRMQKYNLMGNLKEKSEKLQEENENGVKKGRLDLHNYTV